MRCDFEELGPGHGQGLEDIDRRYGNPKHWCALAGSTIGSDHDGRAGVC